MRTETLFYNIESFNADHFYNGSMNSKLEFNDLPLIQRRPGCRRIVFGVDHCTFPNSLYNVSSYWNRIVFSGVEYIVIPGNYSVDTLMVYLQNAISGLTVTFNETTGKLTLAHETLENFTIAGTLLYILGFDEDLTYTATFNQLKAPYCVDLRGTNRLVVRAPALVSQNRDHDTKRSFLLSLRADVPAYEQITYDNPNLVGCTMSPSTICDDFFVQIEDEDGNLVDFNGNHWYMTLFCTYYFDDDTDDIVASLADLLDKFEYRFEQSQTDLPHKSRKLEDAKDK